ncbi:hypothetical protein NKR23_g2238 [Pleurostoma richardsiae]|uniref:Uncharacterized protein n=1 Tax=Pleurostoma richardsiae TaxID=41990 RepID=A0AA38VV29_9PEZI|nr:hypothetical protein NKR23_g2238 [Pleurostoma richardsiae]
MAQPDFAYRPSAITKGPWSSSRSPIIYQDSFPSGGYDNVNSGYRSPSVTYMPGSSSSYNLPATASMVSNSHGRVDTAYQASQAYTPRPISGSYANVGPYGSAKGNGSQSWDHQGRFSPSDSMDEIMASPSLSDYSLENNSGGTTPPKTKSSGKNRSQRRPSNRDEFDGPHQFLQRPPPEYVAMQERELPHLPTNLLVQEQDSVLTQVNDRLSQCAYDFVAKYQFPIPLTQDMRPVERPQDREWTEWVYLLKRLATKRRIPARVLYNGQIKQFVTILENSLEMRHAAKHQSRPLKDDRNILQLISAGIQVAKILKDAPAMDYLDKLYVSTEQQIQERTAAAAARFRS